MGQHVKAHGTLSETIRYSCGVNHKKNTNILISETNLQQNASMILSFIFCNNKFLSAFRNLTFNKGVQYFFKTRIPNNCLVVMF
jgi:hypothetical protein